MSKNYSIIFDTKIPSFIKDDPNYQTFIDFFQSYYTWFNDTYTVLDFESRIDIDNTYSEFLEYYKADFLPNFPQDIATDPVKLIKIAKELYKAKGIPDSFKFLFRALYNASCEIYPTRDAVLKASDGKWLVPKSIKIKSNDEVFLKLKNFKVYGESSQTIGIIESGKISGKYIQLYLSNIDRLFYSGETVRILDSNNKDVYFLNDEYSPYSETPNPGSILLTSKIIGSLSSISIESTKRGQFYNVGDPVVIIGGLNEDVEQPIAAEAIVSEVTFGKINEVIINDGGFGYNFPPNTAINVIYNGAIDSNAYLYVNAVDTANLSYVSILPTSNIYFQQNVVIGANNYNFPVSANANTTLSNALSYTTIATYPISGITVDNGGNGYTSIPTLDFVSYYKDSANNSQNLYDLGVLGPIKILNGGTGYSNNIVNNYITISGGDGHYAYAKISTVNSNGAITAVTYYQNPSNPYTLGGMGYKSDNLPTITVTSNTGVNAVLQIQGIYGEQSVDYTLVTDKIGSITKISLTENGEDYISTPNVSLRVQDIIVSNVLNFSENSIIYQGISPNTATFKAYVDSITLKSSAFPGVEDYLYTLRVYNYKGVLQNSSLKVNELGSNLELPQLIFEYTYTNEVEKYTNGVKKYGDGLAKATAKFLDGLIVDDGRYLNSDGQPSGYSVIQSDIYNNYTYILETEKDYDSYNNVLRSIVHPTGSQVIAKNLLKSNTNIILGTKSNVNMGVIRSNFSANLISNANNHSNSLKILPNTFLFSQNTKVRITTNNYMNVFSTVKSVDSTNNTIYLTDYIQYKYPNVFYGYTNSNSIIITDVAYGPSINNFIALNDTVTIGNNTVKVINYSNTILYFSNTLFSSGNSLFTSKISVYKELKSNNITIYDLK